MLSKKIKVKLSDAIKGLVEIIIFPFSKVTFNPTKSELLPGVLDTLNNWNADGHKIILTTGRKEFMRTFTEEQLFKLGIFYDQLVMGLTRGERIVINDGKLNNGMITCSAIQVERNVGIKDVVLKNK